MSDTYLYVDLLFLSLALTVILLVKATKNKQLRIPPGPKGLPIVGNWFQLPGEKQWETYSRWAKDYGEFMTLSKVIRLLTEVSLRGYCLC